MVVHPGASFNKNKINPKLSTEFRVSSPNTTSRQIIIFESDLFFEMITYENGETKLIQ